MGFIIANFPGLMLGAVAGNRVGAIRDAKGKSVALQRSGWTAKGRGQHPELFP
jgi:hypothetical protein